MKDLIDESIGGLELAFMNLKEYMNCTNELYQFLYKDNVVNLILVGN